MQGILSGLRVVEGSAFVAAPLGGMTLAQMGAEVIRFDPVGGGLDYRRWPLSEDGESLYWTGLNKGKKSVQIDITSEAGQELATDLITAPGSEAGIFLTNFPAKGWLAYERLRERRDDLIMVNVIGHHDGSTAVDYTVNAMVGFPYATGSPDTTAPVNSVIPAWDGMCGLSAATAALAAERHRRKTGAGQYISIALSDVAMAYAGALGHLAEYEVNGEERPRLGNYLFGAFGRDFETRDGERLILIAISPSQWKRLVQTTDIADKLPLIERALGLDFAKEGDRFKARQTLAALIEPWVAARTLSECRAALDEAGVLWGPYQTFGGLMDNDSRASTANPMFAEIDQPGIGRYRVPGSPFGFSAPGRLPPQPAPLLGEHTTEILASVLGMEERAIAELFEGQVVAGPPR